MIAMVSWVRLPLHIAPVDHKSGDDDEDDLVKCEIRIAYR